MNEIFKTINVREKDYRVGSNGTITTANGREIKKRINQDGYEEVTVGTGKLRCSRIKVHRLVAQAFIPNTNPEVLTEVNHKDFNRTNNNLENLEWMSHYDNIQYSVEAGNYNKGQHIGSKNGRARLSEEDVKIIRRLISQGERCIHIAKKYNVGNSTIYNIKLGNTWKEVY